jgi:hypothetical protein
MEINSAWETIRENIKLLSKDSQRKQAKLQWLQDPNEINGD